MTASDLCRSVFGCSSDFSVDRTVGHSAYVVALQDVYVSIHAPGFAPGVLHVPEGFVIALRVVVP